MVLRELEKPVLLIPETYELPDWLGEMIAKKDGDQLQKGAGHKYIRKVPTGKVSKTGRPLYRYYYAVTGGKGLGHKDEFVVGSAFKVTDEGKAGHFHVTKVNEDGSLEIKHDESGKTGTLRPEALRGLLHAHHAEAIESARAKVSKDLADVSQYGSEKQKAQVKARAQKLEDAAGGVEPQVSVSGLRERAQKAREKREEEVRRDEEKRKREAEDRAGGERGGADDVGGDAGSAGGARRRDGGKGGGKAGGKADEGADRRSRKRKQPTEEELNLPDATDAAELVSDMVGKGTPPGQEDLFKQETGPWKPPAEGTKSPAITLAPDLLPEIPEDSKLPDSVKVFPRPQGRKTQLFEHQVDGAERILAAWNHGPGGMVLQDDAGLGKTNTALAAVAALEEQLGRPLRVLVVVPPAGKENLKKQWVESGDLFAKQVTRLDRAAGGKSTPDPRAGWYLCSYEELAMIVPTQVKDKTTGETKISNKMMPTVKPEFTAEGGEQRWDAVLFDEAHTMAKDDKLYGKLGIDLQRHADRSLYMSATPYTNVSDMHYLTKLGFFENREGFQEWAEKAGARVDSMTGEVKNPSSPLPMTAIAATLHVDGLSLKRTTTLDGLESKFQVYGFEDLPPEAREAVKTANDIVAMASEAIDQMRLRALYIGWSRQYLETQKIPKAVELGKKALAQGKQVAFYTSYKAADHAHLRAIPRMILRKAAKLEEDNPGEAMRLEQLAEAIVEEINALPKGISAVEQLTNAFGGPKVVAEIHGATSKKPGSEQELYQAGRKKVVVATMSKGGTGISLHDDEGRAPRVQINLSLPWSGREFDQVAGRSHRLGSQSNTEMHWLVADDPVEKHNATTVAGRLRSMGSLCEGDPEASPDASTMAAFALAADLSGDSDDSEEIVKGIEEAGEEEDTADEAERARQHFREFGEARKSGRDVLQERYDERKAKEEAERVRELRRRQAQIEERGFAVSFSDGHRSATIGGDPKELRRAKAVTKHATHFTHSGGVAHVPAAKLHEIAEKMGASETKVDLAAHTRHRESYGPGVIDHLHGMGLLVEGDKHREDRAFVSGNTYDHRFTMRQHGAQWDSRARAWDIPRSNVPKLASFLGHVPPKQEEKKAQPEMRKSAIDRERLLLLPKWLGAGVFAEALRKSVPSGPVIWNREDDRYYCEVAPSPVPRADADVGTRYIAGAAGPVEVLGGRGAVIVRHVATGTHGSLPRHALDRMVAAGILAPE